MNNRILISVLTTGLFTPIACAQESASQAKSSSVIAVTRGQGDPSPIDVSIKINDGRVESAQLNGEDIPSDRIRRVVDGFEILGADGAVLEHIAATHPDDKRSSASAGLRKAIRIAHGSEANAAQDAARAGSGRGGGRDAARLCTRRRVRVTKDNARRRTWQRRRGIGTSPWRRCCEVDDGHGPRRWIACAEGGH